MFRLLDQKWESDHYSTVLGQIHPGIIPTEWREAAEIAGRKNIDPPFYIVSTDHRIALLAIGDRIVYEAAVSNGMPPNLLIYHPAQAARCRRVYSRLEPHGA